MGGLPWVTVGVNGYREWLGGWGEVAMIAAQGCAINCERERTRIYDNLRERARNDATEATGKRELVRKCETEERGQGGARGRCNWLRGQVLAKICHFSGSKICEVEVHGGGRSPTGVAPT